MKKILISLACFWIGLMSVNSQKQETNSCLDYSMSFPSIRHVANWLFLADPTFK